VQDLFLGSVASNAIRILAFTDAVGIVAAAGAACRAVAFECNYARLPQHKNFVAGDACCQFAVKYHVQANLPPLVTVVIACMSCATALSVTTYAFLLNPQA